MALWLLCWKFAIIAFVQAGIHGTAVVADAVWEQAVRRLVVRMHARAHAYRRLIVDAEGRGQSPPPPRATNRLLAGVAEVNSEDGWLTWSEPFEAILIAGGVEVTPRREKPTEKEERVPLPPIRFISASRQAEQEDDAPRPANEAPLYSDEPRYALKVTCSFWSKRVGNMVDISTSIASVTARPDIVLVAAGECLPLRENRVDVVEATCGAVERAATTTQGFHTRQQLQ